MKNKWREFWYCSDGRFNRASLVKASVIIPVLPFGLILIGPSLFAAWIAGSLIGDEYCGDDKTDAQIGVFVVVLILWVFIIAITTNQGAS